MPSHFGKIVIDPKYRRRWVYNVGAMTSSWCYVCFWGGEFGGTISGEIGRRLHYGYPLSRGLAVMKWAGDRVLGRNHWSKAYRIARLADLKISQH